MAVTDETLITWILIKIKNTALRQMRTYMCKWPTPAAQAHDTVCMQPDKFVSHAY